MKNQQDFTFLKTTPVKTQPKRSRATMQLIRAMKQVAKAGVSHHAQSRLAEVQR